MKSITLHGEFGVVTFFKTQSLTLAVSQLINEPNRCVLLTNLNGNITVLQSYEVTVAEIRNFYSAG
jgi:hypothetical protein